MLAFERERIRREQSANDLHCFFERVDAILRREKRDTELGVLLVEPRGAVRQLESSARRVIDGDCFRREHGWMPVGHAGHEQSEANARSDTGKRGERRVSFETLPRSVAVHRLEVIEAPHAVEAEALGKTRSRGDL